MSEQNHISDPKGRRIALKDGFGNLSEEAMLLFAENKLSESDKVIVTKLADADEMTRDALDGYLLMQGGRRQAIAELKAEVAERTGLNVLIGGVTNDHLPLMRIAAGIALLAMVGAGTYFTSRWVADNKLAMQQEMQQQPAPPVVKEAAPETVKDPAAEDLEEEVLMLDEDSETIETGTAPPPLAAATENKTLVVADAVKPVEKPSDKPADKAKVAEKKPEPSRLEVAAAGAPQAAPTPLTQTPAKKDVEAEKSPEVAVVALAQQEVAQKAIAENGRSAEAERKAEKPSSAKAKREQEAAAAAAAEGASASRSAAKREVMAMAAEDARAADAELNDATPALAHDRVQNGPRFPGGDLEMYRFISRNKNYPATLRNAGISGNVAVRFNIEKDGKITGVQVTQGLHPALDEDAQRVIRAMPKWNPGEENGSPVRTSRTVVVTYN
jgi:periplasmic protein TonB